MMALLAQAASSGEWHNGWQLAVITFTALTIVAGWLHRQSKSDLKSVQDELKAEIVATEARLQADITEVKADLAATRTELKADIAEVKADLVATRTELKAEIAEVRTELKTDIAEVGGDLKDLKDKLYDDARSQAAIYQWQLAATQPVASEASPQQSPPQPKQLAETRPD